MSVRLSWRFLYAERLITCNLGQSVIPVFCLLVVGLTMEELGVKEAICGIAYLTLNIPTGWMADRFSRKACNLIGDLAYGTSLIVLATANSFAGVLAAGVMMALGNATAHGADEALFRAHCKELGKDYKNARKKLQTATGCTGFVFSLIGGWLASYGLQLTLLVASVPFLVGAVFACLIKEVGIHKTAELKNASLQSRLNYEFGGMWAAMQYAVKQNLTLRWLLIANAVGNMLGGPVMILIGPLLLQAGAPVGSLGVAFALMGAAWIAGPWLSQYAPPQWSVATLFLLPCLVSVGAFIVLGARLNLWTLPLWLLVTMGRAWMAAILPALIHDEAPEELQAFMGSLQSTVTMLLFTVVTLAIGFTSTDPRLGVLTNVALFLPLVLIAGWGLQRHPALTPVK